jgi:hypothetical protein
MPPRLNRTRPVKSSPGESAAHAGTDAPTPREAADSQLEARIAMLIKLHAVLRALQRRSVSN